MIKFSILIPVYNVENYIEECLDSVMNQDYKNYEVVIIDDGSTDKSGNICDKYKKEYSKQITVVHKKNQGLISARRTGIDLAVGEYCIFVDSDDKVKFNLLSEILNSIDQNGTPDIVLYSFQYIRNGKIAEKFPHRFQDGQVWEGTQKKELYTCLISGTDIDALCIKAIKTSLLKSDPIFYEQYYALNMSEDTLQSIYPLTAANKVVFLDKALYLYRVINTSISHDFSIESIVKKNTNHVYQTILEYLPIWDLDDEETRLKLEARWFHEAIYTFVMYFEATKNQLEKKEVLKFEWDMMIPFKVRENRYFSPIYLRLYNSMKSKHKWYLNAFFFRRKIKQRWRKMKGNVNNMARGK